MKKRHQKISKEELRILREQKSQHLESGAGGVHYTDEERQQIITGKLIERIQRQHDYFTTQMGAALRKAEIDELNSILERYEDIPDDLKPKWYGIPYPRRVLIQEANCKIADFGVIVSRLNYIGQQLKNVGFTDEHLQSVSKGDFIKDLKQLEEMEKCESKPI